MSSPSGEYLRDHLDPLSRRGIEIRREGPLEVLEVLGIIRLAVRRRQRLEGLCETTDVAVLHGEEQAAELDALLECQLAHHARVEHDHVAGRQVDEHVAGMRVAVEEPVDQQHLHSASHDIIGEDHPVDPGRIDRRGVR